MRPGRRAPRVAAFSQAASTIETSGSGERRCTSSKTAWGLLEPMAANSAPAR